MTLEDCSWGWRNGSAVNRVGCSSRGPRFDSQDPPGSSQPSIAPVPGDLTTPDHLSETRMVPIHTCKQNSQINLKKKKKFFFLKPSSETSAYNRTTGGLVKTQTAVQNFWFSGPHHMCLHDVSTCLRTTLHKTVNSSTNQSRLLKRNKLRWLGFQVLYYVFKQYCLPEVSEGFQIS